MTTLSGDLDRRALEALVIDNPELERLEALLDQFNLFEAIGAVRHELRHSDFLAFLLNPRENHGLGDTFAKWLLQRVLAAAGGAVQGMTPIDLDVWSLDQLLVLREWRNIDLLLVDQAHQVVVVIENKIDSTEHSGQLARYRETVAQEYPGWRVVLVYLTPDGDLPRSDESYVPFDYTSICELVEALVASRASTLGPDVRTLMTHYAQMLRRHIVTESELADLCRRIYQKHRRALDLIYEHRPDQQAEIRAIVERLIRETPGLEVDHPSKRYVPFAVQAWDAVPGMLDGQGWTPSKRIVLFNFSNEPDSLDLELYIGPGPQAVRQTFLDALGMTSMAGMKVTKATKLNQMWNQVFKRAILSGNDYDDATVEQLAEKIRAHWNRFVEHDLPVFTASLRR